MISGITFMSVVVVVLMSVFVVAFLIYKCIDSDNDWQVLKVSKVYEKKNGEWVRIYSNGDDL